MKIQLTEQNRSGMAPLVFNLRRMVNAGYTGRNQEEVRRHIDELAAKGIPGPSRTPMLFPVVRQSLMLDPGRIDVYSEKTCCEVEFVLLVDNRERVFVALGSDHTDRHLEESDIPRAKQICPNIITPAVWPLAEVAPHWDQLQICCRQTVDGEELLYQDGSLGQLMSPDELMAFVATEIPGPLDGYAIFSGALANLCGGFVYGQKVTVELTDPVLKRQLSLAYEVETVDYLEV